MINRLLQRVKKIAQTDFVKVTSLSAVATAIRMIAGFVSVKIVAKIIGPSGIALVGQFTNFITMIGSLSTGAIGQGVTKYIAENYDSPDEQKKIVVHAVRITFISTLFFSLLALVFCRQISWIIFNNDQYTPLVMITAGTLGLYSFNLLLINILNGYKGYRKYIILNIISSILILIFSIFLVVPFGLYGALVNCIVSQTIVILVTLFMVRHEAWFYSLFSKGKIERKVVKKMMGFSLMAITSAILGPLAQISVRKYIAECISLDMAGIWEGMNRFSSMYLSVITTSIAIYYLPKLSEIKDNYLLRAEVLKTAKIILPLLAIGCIIIFISRSLIINLLFSSEFKPMENLFAMQMVGDFLKISSWLIAFLYFAQAKVKGYIIAEVCGALILVLLSRVMVKQYGLEGSVYAYSLTYFIYFLIVLFSFRSLFFSPTGLNR